MALYAISDLHLALSTDKPMDIFGGHWINHDEKIKKNWTDMILRMSDLPYRVVKTHIITECLNQ